MVWLRGPVKGIYIYDKLNLVIKPYNLNKFIHFLKNKYNYKYISVLNFVFNDCIPKWLIWNDYKYHKNQKKSLSG